MSLVRIRMQEPDLEMKETRVPLRLRFFILEVGVGVCGGRCPWSWLGALSQYTGHTESPEGHEAGRGYRAQDRQAAFPSPRFRSEGCQSHLT